MMTSSNIRPQFPSVPIVALIGTVVSCSIWHYRLRFPFDDVFISFRYAEHLATGHGLVWNIGGPHTEGYTNFFFILLIAAAHLVTGHLLAFAQALGLLSTIVTGMFIYRLGFSLRDSATGWIATALYFLTPLTWINALSGMETSLFAMLCILSIERFIHRRFYASFAALLFATLTRPEAVMLGMIFVFAGTQLDGKFSIRTSSAIKASIVFFIGLMLYGIWKWFYFGALLPNSFYVKVLEQSSLAQSHPLLPGLQYVRLFVQSSLALIVCPLGIRPWRNVNILILAGWTVFLLLFYLFVLPLEGLYDRFLWPALTMLCILAAVGLRDLSLRFHLRSVWIMSILAIAIQATIAFFSPRTTQSLVAHEDVWDASMEPIIRVLRSMPHSDSIRFAYGDAGYVVYRSGIYHIDLFGLNDTRIAHATSIAERASAVREERPDLLLLPIRATGNHFDWIEDAYGLARDSSFEPIAITPAFPYTLVWVLNRNNPYYADCKTAFEQYLQDSSLHLSAAPAIR